MAEEVEAAGDEGRPPAKAAPAAAILERVTAFVRDPAREPFERLALEVFAFQYRHIAPYRRLCRSRGATPQTVASWQAVPAVPATAFARVALHAAPAVETFRSSGTTGPRRSVHHHPFPELYREVVERSFPAFCLPAGGRPPMLSLIPPRSQVADSSLGFMVDHVLRRFGAGDSLVAFGPRGVDAEAAGAWCRARGADAGAPLVLATAFALADWLEALTSRGERLALPAGSVVFETGGFKGRQRALDRGELLAQIEHRLGVPSERVVREYGMTELTSQLYSRVLTGGDPDLLFAPPWLRARILEPLTLEPAPAGAIGVIALFDLANVGSAAHLLTEDLGVASGGGIRLLGRAEGADLRGCSLTVEALAAEG